MGTRFDLRHAGMCREHRRRIDREERGSSKAAESIAPDGGESLSPHGRSFRASNDKRQGAVHSDPSKTDNLVELQAPSRRSGRDTTVPNDDVIPEQLSCVLAATHRASTRSLPLPTRHRRPGIRRRMLTISATRASVVQRCCPIRSREPRGGANRCSARHIVSKTTGLTSN